jgi:alkaline phosphatase/streptomycin-6-phosphatase
MNRRGVIAMIAMSAVVAAVGASSAAADGASSPGRDTERAVVQALVDRHPTNVIFFLGDGMGTQEITAARYYRACATSSTSTGWV